MIEEYTITRDDNLNACVIALAGTIAETHDYSNREIAAAIDGLAAALDVREARLFVLDLTRLVNERGDSLENLVVRFFQFFRKRYALQSLHDFVDRFIVVSNDEYIRQRCNNIRGMFVLMWSLDEVRERFAVRK